MIPFDSVLKDLEPRINQAVAQASFLALQEAQAAGMDDHGRADLLKAYVGAFGILQAVMDGKDPEPVRAALRAGLAPSQAVWPDGA